MKALGSTHVKPAIEQGIKTWPFLFPPQAHLPLCSTKGHHQNFRNLWKWSQHPTSWRRRHWTYQQVMFTPLTMISWNSDASLRWRNSFAPCCSITAAHKWHCANISLLVSSMDSWFTEGSYCKNPWLGELWSFLMTEADNHRLRVIAKLGWMNPDVWSCQWWRWGALKKPPQGVEIEI